MKRYRQILYTLIGCMACLLQACQDDLGFSADDMTDGETTLSLEAAFTPFAETALTRATMAPPGRGMNDIADLCLLVYDKDGNLLEDYPKDVKDFRVEEEDRVPANASNGTLAENSTKCIKDIKLRLPFGEYYIIAVANLGDTENNQTTSTYELLKNEYKDACATLDGLRNIKVSWFPTNYRNNNEMLGYFADPDAQSPRFSSTFPTVMVNRSGMKLRAWLRRCASKITIDFDGSGLRENVYVYIKDAKIYDIAPECTLGFGMSGEEYTYNNSVSDEKTLLNRPDGSNTDPNRHHIDYFDWTGGNADDYHTWPLITKGSPYILSQDTLVNFHHQDAKALFFYENMQGNLPEGKTKIPVADLDKGGVADPTLQKDEMACGTYVEVTAHYHSDAAGNIADGEIKYRFMIGKDVIRNCDAERNYHYKLTLKLRGNANDYDWHIDFNEPEGFDVPNPWYVSYLYNHDAMMPFKYTPPAGYKVIGLKAEITQNPWYSSDILEKDLANNKVEIKPTAPYGDETYPYERGDNKYDGNGFLSLRSTVDVVVTDQMASGTNWTDYGDANKSANVKINQAYYKGVSPSNSKIDRSSRIYMENGEIKTDKGNDRERFSYQVDQGKYTFNIPLFTRAKILVKQTGYSGNNPFVGYQRVARVRLTATIEKDGKKETRTDSVNVVQVRRVVNPKGVYRKAGNYDPFHVRMMWLKGDSATAFTDAISHGPWKAEIIGDANFITLNGKQTVYGSTETPIDFTIRFNRMSTGNKNAVVRILYHNYTCTHLVFVRQGYDAQAIAPNGKIYPGTITNEPTVWRTFNMISEDREAEDPRDEGSLFKFGNWEYPIDVINNAYKDGSGNEYYHSPWSKDDFKAQGPFDIAANTVAAENKGLESTKRAWGDIEENGTGFSAASGKINKTATIRDFEQLYLTDNVQFGYGVLYADGATDTQALVSEAYGYIRGGSKHRGMRGMFAYYWDRNTPTDPYNGKNVFFPIGRSGFGHRKEKNEAEANLGKGILRYSANRYCPASLYGGIYVNFRDISPLFESIYRRPGAIYWARNTVPNLLYLGWNGELSSDGIAYGLDINYFSFDVNAITGANIDYGKDACFVRCVE